jgi:inositol transporter-like SP family MFS transporter
MSITSWIILSYFGMGLTQLILFVLLWGASAGFGAQAFYALFSSELFHTRYRAQAQGIMFCIVRLGVGLVSLVVPLMISHVGFPIAGSIMIAFLIISTLVGAIMIPDTRGKSLHSIEQERYGQ